MLFIPTATPDTTAVRRVSGQFLAKNHLSKRARARLAADVLAGKAVITDFTIKQAAALCRVSTPYVTEARGRTPAATRLLRDWNAADHAARVAFARAVGAERVFDVITEAVG